jgi:hypothetical protein
VPADGRRWVDFTQYSNFTWLPQLTQQIRVHRPVIRDFWYPASAKDNAG